MLARTLTHMTTLSLANTDSPLDFAVQIAAASRIELSFPKFSDGRAFSQAALIRERLHFGGSLVATGDVLIDQLVQMQRCGFSHAVLRADQDLAAGQALLAQYAGFYQTDPSQAAAARAAGYRLQVSQAAAAAQSATILMAHGSKDAAWVGTVERMAHELSASLNAATAATDAKSETQTETKPATKTEPQSGHIVTTAYVEHAEPTLTARVVQLLAQGVQSIRLYPLFIGAGHHVKNDVQTSFTALQTKYPHIAFELAPILGEDSAFVAFVGTQLKNRVHGSAVTTD